MGHLGDENAQQRPVIRQIRLPTLSALMREKHLSGRSDNGLLLKPETR
jgi:hypothetical protein